MILARRVLILVVPFATSAPRTALAQITRLNIDSVIAWLPLNTETLVVAKGPMNVADTSDDGPIRLASALAQMAATGPLVTRKPSILETLRTAHIRFAVEGARNFRRPNDLGLGPYEGCHIVVFDGAADPVIGAFLRAFQAASDGSSKVAGTDALRLRWRSEQDGWSAFLVRVRPNVIIIATSEAMLAEVLQRAKRGGPGRAFPSNLPEWSRADTTASVWALRHYAHSGNEVDPTSPIASERRAANRPDSLATGVTVSVYGDSGRFAAHYLSRNLEAIGIAREYWSHPADGLSPSFDSETNGAVSISVPSPTDEARALLLLVILAALGHVIYI